MKNYTCFSYEYLFGDHFAKISNQAKLYYIQLNFFANNGFVPNPIQILDSMGYDKGVFQELVNNGELLQVPDRCEVFITAYFLHNKGFTCYAWRNTPYAVYWENRLRVKKNGIVDFNLNGLKEESKEEPSIRVEVERQEKEDVDFDKEWDNTLNSIEQINK